jgi:CHAT domain-containing protein/Tfp pilus assembly protein PilF
MMPLGGSLSLMAALAMQATGGQIVTRLLARPAVETDSALVVEIRTRPDSAREVLRRLLTSAAVDAGPTGDLRAAQRLAGAYAVAWHDSFLVLQVRHFEAWSPTERRMKIAADSLRRAGNAALGRSGIAAAMRDWRASQRACELLRDSAGIGAAFGNIGAGFYQSGDLDSAEMYLERSRMLAGRIGDHRTEGNAIGTLASVSADRGDLRRAADLYARAAEIRVLTGDGRGAAADRNNLGLIAQSLGDLDRARTEFSEALSSNRRESRDEPAAANLINLGNLASMEGDYPGAATRYREALALYRAHGNRVDAAAVLRDLGLLALQRGDYRVALTNLSRAVAVFRETGPLVEEAGVRLEIALTHAAMGNLQGALMHIGEAERLVPADGAAPALLAPLALARADLAVQFNQFPEAERQYARADRLSRRAGDGRGQAEAARGLGLLLLLRHDYARGQARLELVLRSEEITGDPRSAALTRLLLGYAQWQRGDTAAARATLNGALATLQKVGDAGGEAVALDGLAELELKVGLPLAAESLWRRALDRLGALPAPSIAWRLHAGLGGALGARGATDEAAQELRVALRDIERSSGTLPLEERRAAFLADKWDVYEQLARVELARGHTDAAFEASERLRARELLDLLARGRVAAPAAGAATDALAGQEQDLRRQINVLTLALEGKRDGGSGLRGPLTTEQSSGAVREALAQSQEKYAALLEEMRAARPEYAAMVTGRIAPVRTVMAALGPDEALLEYLVGDATSVVFVVTHDTVATVEIPVSRHELATLVDFARGVLTGPTTEAGADLWRAPLRRLDRYLIEPVEASGLLAGKHALLIAPHAELHYIPFAALLAAPGPAKYLVQRYRLTYTPSASVWLRLHGRARPAASAGEGGVLALAPRVQALPGSRAEVAAIGRIFGTGARILVGEQATGRALRVAAPRQSIIHFATFGVLNKDNPLFSFVELAPSGEDDGRLEVHDVFGLQLHARLVVLSACQTALSAGAVEDVPSGDDWVGLVQAFLSAGASNVLATLWPVDDRATADLMTQFYGALAAGRPEAEALAEAQRALLRNPRTTHPFYWAGFTMNGGQD